MMNVIEYAVSSKHLTSTVAHELLFSFSKRRFIIPAKRDKINNRLIYYLLPGRYIKFSLFASTSHNSTLFKLTWVNVNADNKVEESMIYEYELPYTELSKMERDPNAPKALRMFIEMMPSYHGQAHVEKTDEACDPLSMIEAIKQYLEKKKVEVEGL